MADLDIMRAKLSVLLMDTSNKSWDAGTLDGALRVALSDLGNAVGTVQTIGGLDLAATTTVDPLDNSTLLIGASAYAARARALDLSEKVSLGQGPQPTMVDYARVMMGQFQELLLKVSRRVMHKSSTAPHGAMVWGEEPEKW